MVSRTTRPARRSRIVAAATTALAMPALLALVGPAAPAGAAGDSLTVTSPRCGVIRATATVASGDGFGVDLDQAPRVGVPASFWFSRSATKEWTNVPAGRWSWSRNETLTGTAGVVTVAPCSSTWPRRLPQGDETGDGKADVLAITTSGDLRFYPGSGTGLSPATTVGHGWGSTVFAQRVKQFDGPGQPNALFAVRADGTLWQYRTGARGTVWGGKQVASGLGGYRGYAISPVTTDYVAPELFGLLGRPNASGQQVVALGRLRDVGFERYGQDGAATDCNLQTGTRSILFLQNMGRQGAFRGLGLSKLLAVQDNGDLLRSEVQWTDSIPTRYLAGGTRVGHGWGVMQLVSSPGSLDGDAHSDLLARRDDGDLWLYRVVDGVVQPGRVVGHNWQGIRLLA